MSKRSTSFVRERTDLEHYFSDVTGAQSTLLTATWEGDVDAVRALVEQNAAIIRRPNLYGLLPIEIAIQRGHADVVRVLCALGANPNRGSAHRSSCVEMCISWQRERTLRTLCEMGADVDGVGRFDRTPVFLCAMHGFVDGIRTLIEFGADVNRASSIDGTTPVHIASRTGNATIVRILVEAGADATRTNYGGVSPLADAVANRHVSVVRALFESASSVHPGSEEVNIALRSIRSREAAHGSAVEIARLCAIAQRRRHARCLVTRLYTTLVFMYRRGARNGEHVCPLDSLDVQGSREMVMRLVVSDDKID